MKVQASGPETVSSARNLVIAIIGWHGLLGRAVERELISSGHRIRYPHPIRVWSGYDHSLSIEQMVSIWRDSQLEESKRLVASLVNVDVVINAAGMAAPESGNLQALFSANAILPGLVGEASAEAGVRRLIHISTAAVQGRKRVLDESEDVAPETPYAWSKAAGEKVLLKGTLKALPREVVVYRPTSVMSAERQITRSLVALADSRFVPLSGEGTSPLPVCLLSNVARVVAHLAVSKHSPKVVLHPWEGMTTRSLIETFRPGVNFVQIPPILFSSGIKFCYCLGRKMPSVGAIARRIELIADGQEQAATMLEETGMRLAVDKQSYAVLASEVRASERGTMSL